jgi:hypothetical protein
MNDSTMNRPLLLPLVAALWMSGASALAMPASDDDRDAIKFTATYEIAQGSRTGRLLVTVKIPEGKHIYSLDQGTPPGPTKIKISESESFQCDGKFAADVEPLVIEHDPVFETRIEQFSGTVVFSTPIDAAPDAPLDKLPIELSISGQVCSDDGCVMIRNKKVDVSFGGYYDPSAKEADKEPGAKSASRPRNNQ